MSQLDRVLVHLADFHRVPIDPGKVFYLEAEEGDTLIRTRSKTPLRDVRSLGEVLPSFEAHLFLRIHRNYVVNLRRIREIKQRKDGDGWELKLHPPVNQILPIGRTHEAALWRAFGS